VVVEQVPLWEEVGSGHFADYEGDAGHSALSQVPAFCLLQDLDIIEGI
jgi:hypothetical protein